MLCRYAVMFRFSPSGISGSSWMNFVVRPVANVAVARIEQRRRCRDLEGFGDGSDGQSEIHPGARLA